MLRSFPKHTQNEHKKSPLLAHHRKQVLFYGQKMLGQSGLPARFRRSFRFSSHELQGVYLQCLHGCNRLSSLPNDRLLRKSLCISLHSSQVWMPEYNKIQYLPLSLQTAYEFFGLPFQPLANCVCRL